jgi:hypothetical protein
VPKASPERTQKAIPVFRLNVPDTIDDDYFFIFVPVDRVILREKKRRTKVVGRGGDFLS